MTKDIQAVRYDSENITPEKYLSLTEQEKQNINYAKIVPPQLGKKTFGEIQVIYKFPIFKAAK